MLDAVSSSIYVTDNMLKMQEKQNVLPLMVVLEHKEALTSP